MAKESPCHTENGNAFLYPVSSVSLAFIVTPAHAGVQELSRNCSVLCLCFRRLLVFFVIPVQAVIQCFRFLILNPWIPASAGMTNQKPLLA
jgi:hypothetical protein